VEVIMRFGQAVAAVMACSAMLGAQPAVAEAASGALSLQEAIGRSLERNLDLRAFGYELEAQAGRVQQAGARPMPEVQALAENVLGSGERGDFGAAEFTLSLVLSLERGARERRVDAARARTEVLTYEQFIERLDVAAEASRRFIDVLEAQHGLADAQEATALGRTMRDTVHKRLQAGQVPRAEVARAEAQLARLGLDQEHAEHQLAAARQRLSSHWGESEPDFTAAQGDLLGLPPLEDYAQLRARIAQGGDLERLVSEKRLREAEVRLAEARRRPPWQLTAGVRRFEVDDEHAFVLGVSVPLATRGASQGALAEARARSAQVDARAEALRVRLESELYGLYQELRHSYAQVVALREEVLPRMTDAAEQARLAYVRGRYAYGEWISAQRELLEIRRELLRASAQAQRERIEIERLTGAAVGGRPET
jgi:cobalt-zinc-cadmium efflux system outer membrane protein